MGLDGYIRVSQVGAREGASFISPDIQGEQINAWAAFSGESILRFHTDLDQSGTGTARPGLSRALERVERGRSEGIVVARLDRFARSLTAALELIGRLERRGARFVSVAEGLDPSTPAGKLLTRLMLVMAEFELDRLRENWDEARRLSLARGVYHGHRNPTGYRRGGDGRLRPDPASAAHVVEAFRMRAAFHSGREIAARLGANGVPCQFGAPAWTDRTVSVLIANRAYLGEARSGEFCNRQAHEPLLDRGTWEAAQFARSLGSTRFEPTLLSGLLRCAGCRRLMRAGSPTDRDGLPRAHYWCENVAGSHACDQRGRVEAELIEPLVESRFFALYGASALCQAADPATIEAAAEQLVSAEAALDRPGSSSLATVRRRRLRLVGLTRSRMLPDPIALRRSWPHLSTGRRRRYLALVIEAVFIRPERGGGPGDQILALPLADVPSQLPSGRRASATPFEW